MEKMFLDLYRHMEEYLFPSGCGTGDRRLLLGFLLTVFGEAALAAVNLSLLDEHTPTAFVVYDYVHIGACLLLQVLFWARKLPLRPATTLFFILICAKLSFEAIAYTTMPFDYQDRTFANLIIILIIATGCVPMGLRRLSVFLSVWTGLCLVHTLVTVKELDLQGSLRVFVVIYLLVIFTISYNMHFVRSLLNRHEEEVGEGADVLPLVDPQVTVTVENIVENSASKVSSLDEEVLEDLAYSRICPTLTASERAICKLILQGKTLKEICDTLGKTESNVTSQRAHIRRKLNMTRQDELRSVLRRKVLELREKRG